MSAILASVSPALTMWTVPSTGGMTSFWPTLRSSFDLRWLAHHRVIIDTPKWRAIPVSVSPDRTRYVRSVLRRVGDRGVDGDRLEQRAVGQVRALGLASGSGVAGEVEPGGTGRVDRAVDADPGVVAIAAVLEAGDREPRGVPATARSRRPRRSGPGTAIALSEPTRTRRATPIGSRRSRPAKRARSAAPRRRAQAEPEREALALGSADARRGRGPVRAGCACRGRRSSDDRSDRAARARDRGGRRLRGSVDWGAVRPVAPEGVAGPDRRVLQYGLLEERTGFAGVGRLGVAVRSGRDIELGVSYARVIRRASECPDVGRQP